MRAGRWDRAVAGLEALSRDSEGAGRPKPRRRTLALASAPGPRGGPPASAPSAGVALPRGADGGASSALSDHPAGEHDGCRALARPPRPAAPPSLTQEGARLAAACRRRRVRACRRHDRQARPGRLELESVPGAVRAARHGETRRNGRARREWRARRWREKHISPTNPRVKRSSRSSGSSVKGWSPASGKCSTSWRSRRFRRTRGTRSTATPGLERGRPDGPGLVQQRLGRWLGQHAVSKHGVLRLRVPDGQVLALSGGGSVRCFSAR